MFRLLSPQYHIRTLKRTIPQARRYNSTIGIDLGTTTSAVAIFDGEKERIVENIEGERMTPSVVAIIDGAPLVGVTAKRQAILNPKNTFFSTRKLIGLPYEPDLNQKFNNFGFSIVEGTDGTAWVQDSQGKNYSPTQIISFILSRMKETAEAALGTPVKNAVIGVPSYFSPLQQQVMKDAGVMAGLNVASLVQEPIAAALAYGIQKTSAKNVFVYDLGGAEFNVSVLSISNGVFEVKATGGDPNLGGIDFDAIVFNYLLEEFKKKTKIDLSNDINAKQKLKDTSERVKMELSTSLVSDIQLPYIAADATGPKHMEEKLSRALLERLTLDIINKTVPICKQCLSDAGQEPRDIDEIVLCGGQTRMPKIIETIKEIFGKEPIKGINPDELIALGAAIKGSLTTDAPKIDEVVLLDVIPLNLGIETLGGLMTTLIPANTPIPAEVRHIFSTSADNQQEVEIRILQGNRLLSKDNTTLGKVILGNIPPAPKGEPMIELKITVNTEGIIQVSVVDMITEKNEEVEIKGLGGSIEDISKNKINAIQNQEEDKSNIEIIQKNISTSEKINELQRVLFSLKNTIKESDMSNAMKLFENLRKTIESGSAIDIFPLYIEMKNQVDEIVSGVLLKEKEM